MAVDGRKRAGPILHVCSDLVVYRDEDPSSLNDGVVGALVSTYVSSWLPGHDQTPARAVEYNFSTNMPGRIPRSVSSSQRRITALRVLVSSEVLYRGS